mgnify:CR=1 FL=1
MSESDPTVKPEGAKWPATLDGGITMPPVTQAMLENAAARALASNARRDLIEYLRLRRKAN